MGPFAIRYAGLEHDLKAQGLRVTDYQNIAVPGPESGDVGNPRAKFERLIEDRLHRVERSGGRDLRAGQFSAGAGWRSFDRHGHRGRSARRLGRRRRAVDRRARRHQHARNHPSGNVHGMPVAALLGKAGIGARLGWDTRHIRPERVVLLGTRTLDPGERVIIHELGIRMFTMSEIDQLGVLPVVRDAIDMLKGPGGIHVSFDIDAVDPLEAPGVGTPWPGGLTYREAHLAMELLAATGQVSSMEMVEVNPIADHENRTARLAAELILSALGRTIA